MKKLILFLLIASLILFCHSLNSYAVQMYVGDVDGFGYGGAPGFNGAYGGPADRNGNGLLDSGDVMPDLNNNGVLATGQGDDFDLRSASEVADVSNIGLKWTDVALSTSFSGRPGLADDAIFIFNFIVPTPGDPDYGKDHFVNFVYGDYDVNPMYATVEGNNVTLLGNSDGGGLDGYIWRAYSPVLWSDMLDGQVIIDIIAPNEPYVTFDYALLDLEPISAEPIPEPSTLFLLLLGLFGFVGIRKKSR